MFPTFMIYGQSRRCFTPELRAIAFQARQPTSELARQTSPKRTWDFEHFVKVHLDQWSFHAIPSGIQRHLERYGFLTAQELDAISDTIYTLVDQLQDTFSTLCKAQRAVKYIEMTLDLSDPEVSVHHALLVAQLKVSKTEYKEYMRTFKRYNKGIAKLGAILSRENKSTCDFEDAEAGSVVEPTSPVVEPNAPLA
ncbi:uncharacterized protein MELLADRAFT_59591 [Melampsora larici-populina 98AG31]|uniref:Uncharacterized protein n=1 Tax=Melampsora larici-populina (strain 98AG31 / pathotype 3-4-7) TaxID=747676 RepID=F4R830_MELLP|nr:uncharacterized protein MELLADRAFT_59591 [Melampsora larici-populina 98AG31]EGG11424.1 hypothetical protein MELLADRAFT_59591 [Melampsora larici-populina 98AG31]